MILKLFVTLKLIIYPKRVCVEVRPESPNKNDSFHYHSNLIFILPPGSFLIGVTTGLLTAMITKLTKLCDFPVLETSLFFLMSYASFLFCEAAGFTGIVGILFCAITQSHYTNKNLSVHSKQRVYELFETLNFLAENFVFSYIGLFLFTYNDHVWRPGFIIVAFFAIGIARIANVFPLSAVLNLGLQTKIPCKFQFMMWWAGKTVFFFSSLNIVN